MEIVVLVLSIISSVLLASLVISGIYQKKFSYLEKELSSYKSLSEINSNVINAITNEFSKVANETIKNQQQQLISQHSNDLLNKLELFKSTEILPINKLLQDFKQSIDSYNQIHHHDSLDIKNAIEIAQKYAKALTTDQNARGEFGEDWLEQILKFCGLCENIHYVKQYSINGVKPDFLLKLPDEKNIIIDSKVILKNYIEYINTENEEYKKSFITDLTNCINNLAKKNYEDIEGLNQPGFILMFIPIESCLSFIYTDYDFKKVIELANSKNIVLVGSSSIIVTLRLVNQLWTYKKSNENVQNIINVGENIYNYVAIHAQNLLNIQQSIENVSKTIQTEINRFTTNNNGSIFKEAEKLKNYGLEAKVSKVGKGIIVNSIPEELLSK